MFQTIVRRWVLLLVLAAASVTAAFAENRVALVIGNSAYLSEGKLDNPRNDAADMAAALEKLGFKVIRGLDLDKARMDRAIRDFAAALQGASMGVFYYAGHGLEVDGKNYLVPIDAQLKTAEALYFETVRLDVVQSVMEGASATNVLFVDACRDNPFLRNLKRAMGTRGVVGRGLAVQKAGAGTLISFSTQPGFVAADGRGRNSPYTASLVKHIPTPGKELPAILVRVRNDVMTATSDQQVPWDQSALTAEVVLAPQAPDQKPAKLTTAPAGETGAIKPVPKEAEGSCTSDILAARFVPEFAKLKRVYDAKLMNILEWDRRRQELIKQMVPELARAPVNEECTLRKHGHISDIYSRQEINILEYDGLKKVLSDRLFGK